MTVSIPEEKESVLLGAAMLGMSASVGAEMDMGFKGHTD